MVRPMADLGLHLAEMVAVADQDGPRVRVARGQRRVPSAACSTSWPTRVRCSSQDIPDTSEVPWASTGWTNDRNVTQMLELLASRGEVAVSGRRGRQRLWDLAERVYPAATPTCPRGRGRGSRDERRLRSLGHRPPEGRRRGR